MGKTKKGGLTAQLDKATRRRLESDIKEIRKPFFESERVLVTDSAKIIREIARHVQSCTKVFVTPDKPQFAPVLPAGLDFDYLPMQEITAPRERPYCLDRDGRLRALKVEVRQEVKNGSVVQTTKVGNGASSLDSTMDRWEQKSILGDRFGFNVFAIGDDKARANILESLESYPKNVLRLISQRIRIPYHPEGNPDLLIELALEPLHCGETFTGHVWHTHKIDVEIKKGPSKAQTALRHSILAREEERLMGIFPLTRQLVSSASPGFDAIMEDMAKDKHRSAFDRLDDKKPWWLDKPLPPIAKVA